MNFWYWLGRLIIRSSMRIFGRVEVVGLENVPPLGPLIVVSNHQSNADAPLLAGCFKRPLWFLAKEGLFRNPLLNYFLRAFHLAPLQRNGRDVEAVRRLLGQLGQDKAILLFPEGTRRPGALGEGIDGVTYLALRSQASILPVGITGTERVPSYLRGAFPFTTFRVVIGKPYTIPLLEGRMTRPALKALTTEIMERISVLLPPKYRGRYPLSPKTTQ